MGGILIHRLSLSLIVLLLATAACQRPTSEPDSKNELPFGFIDAPAQGAAVARQIQMYGWALDDEGVREVRIFVDGKFLARTTLTQARPDVTKAYPRYAAGTENHGWALTVTLGEVIPAGSHTLLAQAVDTKGATRDIGTVTVSVSP